MFFFNEISTFPQPVPIGEEVYKEVAELEDLISRKDYSKIIKSEKLFWGVFCYSTALVDAEKKQVQSGHYSIVNVNGNLKISARRHILEKVKRAVNEIRLFYVDGLKKKENFQIVFPVVTHDVFIRAVEETINLDDWLSDKVFKIPNSFFRDWVKPYLQQLSSFVGTEGFIFQKKQKITTGSEFSDREENNVSAFQVTWNKDGYLTYPITPVKVEVDEAAKRVFYPLYRDQILCDLEFLAKKNELIVKTHAAFLYIYGGEMMKTLLMNKMEESLTRKIQFKEFDKPVVRAYSDFIYLSLDDFNKKYSKKGACDLVQLFKLAQMYQLEPLINCCTNLISLLSGPEDLKAIDGLAKLYENAHLKRLAAYFREPKPKSSGEGGVAASVSSSSSNSSSSRRSVAPKPAVPSSQKSLDDEDDDDESMIDKL